jgi:hypothetical protein
MEGNRTSTQGLRRSCPRSIPPAPGWGSSDQAGVAASASIRVAGPVTGREIPSLFHGRREGTVPAAERSLAYKWSSGSCRCVAGNCQNSSARLHRHFRSWRSILASTGRRHSDQRPPNLMGTM